MSGTAVRAASPDLGHRRVSSSAESADLNVGLLAALAACVACWVMVGLTAYWLI